MVEEGTADDQYFHKLATNRLDAGIAVSKAGPGRDAEERRVPEDHRGGAGSLGAPATNQ